MIAGKDAFSVCTAKHFRESQTKARAIPHDVILRKQDADDGDVFWKRDSGSSPGNVINVTGFTRTYNNSIATDSSGNVYVVGNPGVRCPNIPGLASNASIRKYDNDGALIWEVQYDHPNTGFANRIVNQVFVGSVSQDIYVRAAVSAQAFQAGLLARLSKDDGSHVWASPNFIRLSYIWVDPGENLYGVFFGGTSILKFDSADGSLEWSTIPTHGSSSRMFFPNSIRVFTDGGPIYCTATGSHVAQFDNLSPPGTTLQANWSRAIDNPTTDLVVDGTDMYIAHSSGGVIPPTNLKSASKYSDINSDFDLDWQITTGVDRMGISLDSSGDLYICGHRRTADGDTEASTHEKIDKDTGDVEWKDDHGDFVAAVTTDPDGDPFFHCQRHQDCVNTDSDPIVAVNCRGLQVPGFFILNASGFGPNDEIITGPNAPPWIPERVDGLNVDAAGLTLTSLPGFCAWTGAVVFGGSFQLRYSEVSGELIFTNQFGMFRKTGVNPADLFQSHTLDFWQSVYDPPGQPGVTPAGAVFVHPDTVMVAPANSIPVP